MAWIELQAMRPGRREELVKEARVVLANSDFIGHASRAIHVFLFVLPVLTGKTHLIPAREI
ncbi:MAG: hypothetical protein RQ754_08165 [Desulfuromonadales bacterium]|nr:hypothetical protein [Desulfuromonadales bacterium]